MSRDVQRSSTKSGIVRLVSTNLIDLAVGAGEGGEDASLKRVPRGTMSKTGTFSIVRRLTSNFGRSKTDNAEARAPLKSGRPCVVVGPANGGKTVLLRACARECEWKAEQAQISRSSRGSRVDVDSYFQSVPPPVSVSTRPTVGVQNTSVTLDSTVITFREVGSALSLMWHSYYPQASSVVYVVDCSSPSDLAAANVELMGLFHHLRGSDVGRVTPVAIVLNKIDDAEEGDASRVKGFLRLDDVSIWHSGDESGREGRNNLVTIIETSAITGEGLIALVQWAKENVESDPAGMKNEKGSFKGLRNSFKGIKVPSPTAVGRRVSRAGSFGKA